MMNKKLYFECCSGISGDMTVAALLDLGADESVLREVLESVPVKGFSIQISRVKKSGIDACDFDVILDKEHENHDHDMEYLFGQEKHSHKKHHHHHEHEHRGMEEVTEIVESTKMTKGAKKIALRIFEILASAEAKAHATTVEEVHFHEVGAVDSIVDIISTAVCLDNLGIKEVVVPVLYEGCGMVRCQHGILPVPVPAVLNIVSEHRLKIHQTTREAELVTPTGAAIVAAIKTSNQLPQEYFIEKVGIGAGKREYETPSLLRVMIITEENTQEERDCIYKLETNIDDCSGEVLGYVMERLMNAGARDVNYTPLYMKKNRPAYQLNVICKEEDITKLEDIIFKETTTIGIRKQKMERRILVRREKKIATELGSVQAKICKLDNQEQIYPEYSSVVELCKKYQMSFEQAYEFIKQSAVE
jgi:hypothetical protein